MAFLYSILTFAAVSPAAASMCPGPRGDSFCGGLISGSYCKFYQDEPGRFCQFTDIPCECDFQQEPEKMDVGVQVDMSKVEVEMTPEDNTEEVPETTEEEVITEEEVAAEEDIITEEDIEDVEEYDHVPQNEVDEAQSEEALLLAQLAEARKYQDEILGAVHTYKWDDEQKEAFKAVIEAIVTAGASEEFVELIAEPESEAADEDSVIVAVTEAFDKAFLVTEALKKEVEALVLDLTLSEDEVTLRLQETLAKAIEMTPEEANLFFSVENSNKMMLASLASCVVRTRQMVKNGEAEDVQAAWLAVMASEGLFDLWERLASHPLNPSTAFQGPTTLHVVEQHQGNTEGGWFRRETHHLRRVE